MKTHHLPVILFMAVLVWSTCVDARMIYVKVAGNDTKQIKGGVVR